MEPDANLHCRQPLRFRGYDYSLPGFYFVTVCTQNKACLFGDIVEGGVHLTEAGHVAVETWRQLPHRFSAVALDEYVVMPNHVHGIIQIVPPELDWAQRVAPLWSSPAPGAGILRRTAKQAAPLQPVEALSDVMRAFKSTSAILINRLLKRPQRQVWQRNYYEHVIRNENELTKIREDINQNPLRWDLDRENPAASHAADVKTSWGA